MCCVFALLLLLLVLLSFGGAVLCECSQAEVDMRQTACRGSDQPEWTDVTGASGSSGRSLSSLGSLKSQEVVDAVYADPKHGTVRRSQNGPFQQRMIQNRTRTSSSR